MTRIYNISKHVGAVSECANLPDDVMLMQLLIRDIRRTNESSGSAIKELPALTGKMDAVTSHWIWFLQKSNDGALAVDGIVSPVKGLGYGQNYWLVSALNITYKDRMPDLFERIPENPELSPSLRAALKLSAAA